VGHPNGGPDSSSSTADLLQALADFIPTGHLMSYGGVLRYIIVGEPFPRWQFSAQPLRLRLASSCAG